MHNPKLWFGLIIAIVSSFLLVAFQPAPPQVIEKEVAAQATTEPEGEQILRILHPAFDQDWSPMLGGGHVSRLYSLMWAAPMYYDAKGEIHPQVFTEWISNDDFTQWTFTIDPKAVFSDGSSITAEDVKGTWDLSAHPATAHARIDLQAYPDYWDGPGWGWGGRGGLGGRVGGSAARGTVVPAGAANAANTTR